MPATGMTVADLTPLELQRFQVKIQRDDADCWIWTGEVNNRGYGRFTVYRGERRFRPLAHRLAYELANGELARALVVRHSCDNPPCCNPAHLSVGTQRDNARDAQERGRDDTSGFPAGWRWRSEFSAAIRAAAEKHCAGCDQVLPLEQFHRNKVPLHGRASRCKPCANAENRARRAAKAGALRHRDHHVGRYVADLLIEQAPPSTRTRGRTAEVAS